MAMPVVDHFRMAAEHVFGWLLMRMRKRKRRMSFRPQSSFLNHHAPFDSYEAYYLYSAETMDECRLHSQQ